MLKSEKIPIEGPLMSEYLAPNFKCQDQFIALDLSSLGMRLLEGAYAVQVQDNSMIGDGIAKGDIAVLAPAQYRHGDIVAVRMQGRSEVTLRRYIVAQGIPMLVAENPAAPELLPAYDTPALGVLWALVRMEAFCRRECMDQPKVSYSKKGPLNSKKMKRALWRTPLGPGRVLFNLNENVRENMLCDAPPKEGYGTARTKPPKPPAAKRPQCSTQPAKSAPSAATGKSSSRVV